MIDQIEGKRYTPHPPEQILFVSDVHLGGFQNDLNKIIERDFLELMKFAEKNNFCIVILGDLFDYYMQYGSYVPEISRNVFRWFSEYHTVTDKRSLYITGNHDNWDSGMISLAGFDTEHEYRLITLANSKKLLVFHGDGLSDSFFDYPRPAFHRLLRNQYFVRLFRLLTNGRFGNRIMKGFSQWKRSHPGDDAADKARLDNAAKRMLSKEFADIVICGHHHESRFISDKHGLYINTGAFFSDRTLSVYTNESFQLVRWDGTKKQLISITSNPGT
jgi:UDP-2,3-diacylglucosamine pyrophosphatase LpxH